MDADDRALLARTTRHVLETTAAADVLPALRDLGWFEARAVHRSVVEGDFFEAQGESLAVSGVLDAVVSQTLEPSDWTRAVVFPLPGRATSHAGHAERGVVDVDGLAVGPSALRGDVGFIVFTGAGAVATEAAAALRREPVEGVDPWGGWVRITGRAPCERLAQADPALAAAVARRALAHELVGVVRGMLALAVTHVAAREQFGQPIGGFQAVQHRLADTRVALEVAEHAVAEAWHESDGLAATMAKLLAGAAARTAAKHCQQVLGGMGFTWDHALHRYVRRGIALDRLCGSYDELCADVGGHIAASGRAPRLVQL